MEKESGFVLVLGNMWGGKTSELIRRLKIEESLGKKVQAFKVSFDDRYGEGFLMTHNGAKYPATSVRNVREMISLIKEDTQVIGIDEAQFWDHDLIEFVRETMNDMLIIVAGLQMNFRGESFRLRSPFKKEFSSDKYHIGDLAVMGKIVTVYPECTFRENGHICRAAAIFPQRFRKDGTLAPYSDPEILVGAEDSYLPRCHAHFVKPLLSGKFLYQGKEYSQEELRQNFPSIFRIKF